MSFGQVVLGGPGAGKTSYCRACCDHLRGLGRRVAIINLDPANEQAPHDPAIDITSLVSLPRVMEDLGLGPNGGLIYCMEYLERNLCWLDDALDDVGDAYLLFDLPGQVELFANYTCMTSILSHLTRKRHCMLTTVYLMDSTYGLSPFTYIGAIIRVLACMLHLEMPHVSVLSKVGRLQQEIDCGLDYYTELTGIRHLPDELQNRGARPPLVNLAKSLAEVIEDFNLVAFMPLELFGEDRQMLEELLEVIDRSNGYAYIKGDAQADRRDLNGGGAAD